MLACLVSRLAPADSCSTDCGILVLDEPTADLIEAAWRAWRGSECAEVESRKRQANDQLIPIWHDQGLLSKVPTRSPREVLGDEQGRAWESASQRQT
jgi:alpha-D-ribose 1-methylphosphonate 5-triphosphate synthase subunit PhnL